MDGSLAKGSFCLIGIADAREPDTIVPQLKRLSLLVDPSEDADVIRARNAEVARLIEQLDDPSYAIRQRATTQLAVGARAAAPQLREASTSTSLEKSSRAKRILDQLEKENELAAKKSCRRRSRLLVQPAACNSPCVRPTSPSPIARPI